MYACICILFNAKVPQAALADVESCAWNELQLMQNMKKKKKRIGEMKEDMREMYADVMWTVCST